MAGHLNLTVTGRVQGVFFRASAKEIADRLGLRGFVRNERDGSVYIEVEGNHAELDQFVAWCRQGPLRAHVSNVQVTDGAVARFSSFEIRRS